MKFSLFRPVICTLGTVFVCATAGAAAIDLSQATVVVRGAEAPLVEQTAATVLVEEIEKRTGLRWTVTTEWPSSRSISSKLDPRNPATPVINILSGLVPLSAASFVKFTAIGP